MKLSSLIAAPSKFDPMSMKVGRDPAVRPFNDDDVYLRLQHGKEFYNLVYMFYVKHINPSNKA
jgi:hypothetical protein